MLRPISHDQQVSPPQEPASGRSVLDWLLYSLLVFFFVAGVVLVPRGSTETVTLRTPTTPEHPSSIEPQLEIPQLRFTDITKASGIEFQHETGANGDYLMPETLHAGCAFFDFDNDNDADILLINGRRHPWKEDESDSTSTACLLANDGSGRFRDVTSGSGLDVSIYGTGVAVGDYDDDGLVDVYIASLHKNRLFHNEGAGKFRDVTSDAGVGGAREWSSSTGFFDFDNDGDLDLFVANYILWNRAVDMAKKGDLVVYGRPQDFTGTFPCLYRNEGDGRFTDVTDESGLRITETDGKTPVAKSLGVTFSDVNDDGWLDILVANDTQRNALFLNRQNGTFSEEAVTAGIAFSPEGEARAGMGIDAAHFRNSSELGIAIGNFGDEMTALFVSQNSSGGPVIFVDEAVQTGIGRVTLHDLTFGLFFFDCDLDGRLDLFTVNGHVQEFIHLRYPDQSYQQPPRLFWNSGLRSPEFVAVPEENCGSDLLQPIVGRGAAYADIDGDGDLDVLISVSGGHPRLLRNDQQTGNHWLRLKLRATVSNLDAIGAKVTVVMADGRQLFQTVMPTRSYLSQVELPLTFGLGQSSDIRQVTIMWPDGSIENLSNVVADQFTVIHQATNASN